MKKEIFNNYCLFEINTHNFLENIWHSSVNNNSKMMIENGDIYLNKFNSRICDYCWIGYNISERGTYKLTFEILYPIHEKCDFSLKNLLNKMQSPFLIM
jgi:hypothetical protein